MICIKNVLLQNHDDELLFCCWKWKLGNMRRNEYRSLCPNRVVVAVIIIIFSTILTMADLTSQSRQNASSDPEYLDDSKK